MTLVLNTIQAVFFLLPITAIATFNIGTALYDTDDVMYKTWTGEDVLMLRSRMLMDHLIPKHVVSGKTFLDYVKLIIKTSETIVGDQTRRIAMVSVADAIGGYLQGVMIPHANEAYYRGRESFKVTDELHALLRKIKFVLDTDGRGWMPPVVDVGRPAATNAAVRGKYDADADDDGDDDVDAETENPCAALLLYGAPSDGQSAAVPLPAFDDNSNPGTLAFPFAVGKRLFAVDRPWTAADDRRPLLVRYYRLAAGCTSSAPHRFRADMNRWLDDAVVPLLADRRRWYPVLAGARRVVRAAAKAVGGGGDGAAASGRQKRRAAATTTTTTTAVGRPATTDDDEIRRSCDDGPDSRVPNSNVPLAVILVSLVLVWTAYGCVFGSRRQS